MTHQPSLLKSNVLPQPFVDEWDRLEVEHKRRPIVEVEAVESRHFRWTIALKVNGKRVAMVNREDLVQAARDAWALAPQK